MAFLALVGYSGFLLTESIDPFFVFKVLTGVYCCFYVACKERPTILLG